MLHEHVACPSVGWSNTTTRDIFSFASQTKSSFRVSQRKERCRKRREHSRKLRLGHGQAGRAKGDAEGRRRQGQPVGAVNPMLGVDMDAYLHDLREKIQSGEVHVGAETLGADALPISFDAATNPAWKACSAVISDIRDQSACGIPCPKSGFEISGLKFQGIS